MIKNRSYLLIILIAFSGILWTACSQQRSPCLTPKEAILNVECMHLLTDTSTIFADTLLPAPRLIALTGFSIDTLIYGQTFSFILSLSPDTTFCKWLFKTDTLVTTYDTITFFYTRSLQFLSNACGYADFYTLTSVTGKGTMIDSVHITNPSVTNNVNTKHLQVYIHPDF